MLITAIGSATPKQILTNKTGEAMQRRLLMWNTDEPVISTLDSMVKYVYRGEDNIKRHCVATKYSDTIWNEDQSPEIRSLNTGTEQRMNIYMKEALELSVRSIDNLSARIPGKKGSFSHIIYVSCTGQAAPGISIGISEHLAQDSSTKILEINFFGGCAGLLVGLQVARDIIDADRRNRVLLCATELCSIHFRPTRSMEQVVINSIFGDGSISMVCEAEGSCSYAEGATNQGWEHLASSTRLLPGTRDMITWDVGGMGFAMGLSPTLPKHIEKGLKSIIENILQQHELRLDDIGQWAIHPGGPKIIDACQNALSLSEKQTMFSRRVFRDYGNMSSPTVGFILKQMQVSNVSGYCVAIAFAPGVRVEVAILHRQAN